jgi:Fe-S-cluster-containing dehydrogenase component
MRTVRAHKILMTAVACRTCEDPPCVIACPRDALTQDEKTGIIHIDASRCDGCAWCIEACDFGAISINPATKLAEICNMCEDVEEGPQCVKWCPKEALELTTPDQQSQKTRHKLLIEEVAGA